jgi:hypothetical protein
LVIVDDSEHKKLLKGQPEHLMVAFAAAYLLGFRNTFRDEVRRFREMVDSLDKTVNPVRS